jgi:hypothetical protein
MLERRNVVKLTILALSSHHFMDNFIIKMQTKKKKLMDICPFRVEGF